MEKCKNCHGELTSWSDFKERNNREGIAVAIAGSLIKGVEHMFLGNLRHKEGADHWSLGLYLCQNCKKYYLKCPNCGNLMPLDSMPKNGKTMVDCTQCGHKTLYAGDYDMGG